MRGHQERSGSLFSSVSFEERIDGEDDPPPRPSGPGEGFGAPRDGKKRAKGDCRRVKLSNQTHRSSTDPVDAVFFVVVALLARKSNAQPALPSYRGHVPMDNRHDLIVDCRVTRTVGFGERDAAVVGPAPRGLRPIDQCTPRYREGVWLDLAARLVRSRRHSAGCVSSS
jgi:hypothetical protein